jgi:hypothetical protein
VQLGKKMISQAEFEIERRSQPIARLEIHSAFGKPPTRAEITSALTKLVQGRFTLSLQSPRADRVYVVEIVPADAVTWFAENCESFNRQVPSDALTAVSAQIYWEELKRQVARSSTEHQPFVPHSSTVLSWMSGRAQTSTRQVAVSRSSWRVTQPTVSLLVLPRWVVPHPSRAFCGLGGEARWFAFSQANSLRQPIPPQERGPLRFDLDRALHSGRV